MISFFGEVHNPWDPTRIAGGSSGGSAASVAAGLGFAAVGTDTAGSIRLPAAYCGVVGLKPTYGRVSTRGVVPLSSSYDHVGPLTNSVYDAALMLQVMSDYDSPNPCADRLMPSLVSAFDEPPANLRIGVPRAFFFDDLHPEIADAIEKAIQVFAGLPAEIRDIKLEVPTDRTLASAEAYAYHKPFVDRSPELYQPATLARIQSGAKISAPDALRASRELQASRHDIQKIFDEVDVLLTPTVPIPPPRDRRPARASRQPAAARVAHAQKHAALQCLGNSHDFRSVRIHKRRPADRPATGRRSLAGDRFAAGGTCVRTSDGVAQEEAGIGRTT